LTLTVNDLDLCRGELAVYALQRLIVPKNRPYSKRATCDPMTLT
jgi:hypothetical protein